VPVSVMAKEERAQDRGARRYAFSAVDDGEEREEESLEMDTPIVAEMMCPRIVFRGWERGEERMLNSRIAAAPFVLLTPIFST
jgi:hypothetical protein